MSASATHSNVRLTSTVSPDESASQGGVSGGAGSQFSTLNPLNFDLSRCVFTAEDYLKIFESCGKDEAVKFRQLMEQQVQLMGRCVSMQFGAVRSASSSERSVSSALSYGKRSAGGSSPGLAGIMRMQSWRKKVPDGLCYSKTLKSSVAQSQVAVLGEWPLAASLLRAPASHFQSLDELERFRVVGDADRTHVKAGGVEGHSFLASMARLASSLRCPVGTFGAVLKADGRSFGASAPITARTLVGGTSQPSSLKGAVESMAGVKFVGQRVDSDFRLASVTAGMHDAAGKEALRMREAVGDAALTLVLAQRCSLVGSTVQQYQAARAACTNNSSLSRLFASKFDLSFFSAPSGVAFDTGRVGAGVLEALLGIVFLYEGVAAVATFCDALDLFSLAFSAVPALSTRFGLGSGGVTLDSLMNSVVVSLFGSRPQGWKCVDTIPEGDAVSLKLVDTAGAVGISAVVYVDDQQFCGLSVAVGGRVSSVKWPLRVESVSSSKFLQCLRDRSICINTAA